MAEFDPDAYLAGETKKRGFDPDAYLKKTEPKTATSLAKDFGKATASLADTALNAATGTLDWAAYPLARAYHGLVGNNTPEQAAALAQQETTSPKDVIGRAFGIENDPAYQNEASRRLMNAVGSGVNQYAVQPLTQASGLPQADVANMVGSGLTAVAPAAGRGAQAVGQGVQAVGSGIKAAGGAASDVAQGAYGGLFNTIKKPGQPVSPWETPSARQPVGETYIPAPILEQWRRGEITAEQAQAAARPTAELPVDALRQTQGMVPYKGQEWRALGEQIGSSYRNPYKLGAEIAGDYLLGGLPTAARLGLKGYDLYKGARAYNELGKAGFTPMSPAELQALRSGGTTPPNQVPKAVSPAELKATADQAVLESLAPTPTISAAPLAAPLVVESTERHKKKKIK